MVWKGSAEDAEGFEWIQAGRELQEEAGSAREAFLDVGGFWRFLKMYGCFRMVQECLEGLEGC